MLFTVGGGKAALLKDVSWEEAAAIAKQMGIKTWRWTGKATAKVRKVDLIEAIAKRLEAFDSKQK